MNQTLTTYTFHVNGMHCKACTILIEDELKGDVRIEGVIADLGKNTATVTGAFGDVSPEELSAALSERIRSHGYSLAVERRTVTSNLKDFQLALPIALGFIAGFLLLQKTGLVNLVSGDELGYGAIFLIGIIASLSTCMAVVGGLVLSMSASFAKGGDAVRPQLLFHIGRIVSFFILGGVIGVIGNAFTLNTTATFILNFVIGLVMLILGVNLLDIFHRVKGLQLSMPAFMGRHVQQLSRANHSLTPFLVGIATFFLPCGFTQSMQLYTLSTGSFMAGGLTMLVFALGTLPVLAAVSFSSYSVAKSAHKGVFYKTAGLIVIAFALMNIYYSFVIMGLIPPIFTF
jgi:uncharacterized protein